MSALTPLIQPSDPHVDGLIAWLDIARSAQGFDTVFEESLQRAAYAASLFGLPAPAMKTEQPA